ncbi:MAG: Mur ligase family protein [Microbacteriaceae bacterium]
MPIDIVWILITVAAAIAAGLATLKWLRVGQREHYIPGSVTTMALLWLRVKPLNAGLVFAACVVLFPVIASDIGVITVPTTVAFALVLVNLTVLAIVPVGLSVRGRTSTLGWTPRMRRLAALTFVVIVGLSIAASALLGFAGSAIVILYAAPLTDLALLILKPLEKALSKKFLVAARKRLSQVRPRIVAITGSYGKTSTKGYVAHVLGDSFTTVASPASFNNMMGLSRAVNERVVPGTEVFVAEMGINGKGQIRELAKSFPPDIAAITTIGEAHIARLKSREAIFSAKAEITENARIVVLPIDDPMLAGLAETCRAAGKVVITVSTVAGTAADVVVDAANETVTVSELGRTETARVVIPSVGHAVNLAVAVGIARALELPLSAISARLGVLPDSRHRAEIQEAASGVMIVDDTYNSNPVGADRAVRGAAELAAERGGALVVVTPGMVELGHVQVERNRAFAATVAELGGHLFAIARTNRKALVAGSVGGPHPVRLFEARAEAVAAALDQAGDRGVILYENDLPDHYP